MTTAYSYIRFRRGDQQKGDSLDRQIEKSEEYARRKGWTLDSSFRDLGVSAFRGRNDTQGALSRFLEAVDNEAMDNGTVKKGSVLIRHCPQEDKAEWERWADEPIEPHLGARIMCAVYSTKSIPPELQVSREAMEEVHARIVERRRSLIVDVRSMPGRTNVKTWGESWVGSGRAKDKMHVRAIRWKRRKRVQRRTTYPT
jgi:hypothetical protein